MTGTPSDIEMRIGRVVKLDRKFPLVELQDAAPQDALLRCEHSTTLIKGAQQRCVIGDIVDVQIPEGHDKGIVAGIHPRTTQFVRKDPTERTVPQTLAANFDLVAIAEPITQLNMNRLQRELVLAHQTRARVAVLLTKSDLQEAAEVEAAVASVRDVARADVEVLAISVEDEASIEAARNLIGAGHLAVLLGKSGVGKSSLVNVLVGAQVQATSAVRERDGKGRHTTVSREIVALPSGGSVIDMPGIRGLGLWNAQEGLAEAFSDIESLAANCKFRDCNHTSEPDCAVQAAIAAGTLAPARLASYHVLQEEAAHVRKQRDEADRLHGEKASDKKKPHTAAKGRGRRK